MCWLQCFLASLITLHFITGVPLPSSTLEPIHEGIISVPNKLDFPDKHLNQLLETKQDFGSDRFGANTWSYQPFIEYSNVSPHSTSITQIAFGKSAVEALQNSKEPKPNTQSLLYFPPELDKALNASHRHSPLQQNLLLYHPPAREESPPHLYYSHLPQLPHENIVYITPQATPVVSHSGRQNPNTQDPEKLVEANTAKAIIEEYERHYVKKNHLSSTPLSVTEFVPLSRQPIIVPDVEENNLSEEHTLVTTSNPRKVFESTTPQILSETPKPLTSQNNGVVVEIQKSVPYYLGKFEFVQNAAAMPNRNTENQQNVELGTTLLKYSLENPPNLELNQSNSFGTHVPYSEMDTLKQESTQPMYKILELPVHKLDQQTLTKEVSNMDKTTNQIIIEQHLPTLAMKPIPNYVHNFPQQAYFHHPSLQIPPLHFHHKPQVQQQSHLLEPFHGVTKLIPHKSYTYTPSYLIHHQPQRQKHKYVAYKHVPQGAHQSYQGSHKVERNKKPKNAYYAAMRTNYDYDGGTQQGKGPQFKGSQLLQTMHEQLPAVQASGSREVVRTYRNPRHSFENTIRLEYGFMPPLIPSIEIDENGKPIEKSVDH